MAQANDHTESARIRTILEITAFDLATLEYELIRHGYIPDSTGEKEIRDATYRFYMASDGKTFTYHTSTGHHNLFDPYPYGGMPQQESRKDPGAERAAAMADRNERVSVKYDAVRDLIRMLASRKVREGKPDESAAPAMKVAQAAVKVPEARLEADQTKIKALEDQLQAMRTAYAALKVLAAREHAGEVREIDRGRFHKLMQLALSRAAGETAEIAQQFANIQMEKRSAARLSGQKAKEGGLERPKWEGAGEGADDVNQEVSTTAKDDEDEKEEEEQSEISSADAPKASRGPIIRKPKALKRARKAAMEMEMAAQKKDEEAAQQQRILSVQELLADVEREIADGQERRNHK